MNFNFPVILSLLLIAISSCGVKSDPVPPPGTSLPSIPNEYLYIAPAKPKPAGELIEEDTEEETEESSKPEKKSR